MGARLACSRGRTPSGKTISRGISVVKPTPAVFNTRKERNKANGTSEKIATAAQTQATGRAAPLPALRAPPGPAVHHSAAHARRAAQREAWEKEHKPRFTGHYGRYADDRFCGQACGYNYAVAHTRPAKVR